MGIFEIPSNHQATPSPPPIFLSHPTPRLSPQIPDFFLKLTAPTPNLDSSHQKTGNWGKVFFYNSWFQQCMFKQDMRIICIVLVLVHYAVSTNIPYARLVARKGRNWEWRLSWRQQHCTLLSASSSPLLSSFSFPSSSSSSSSFSYPLFPAIPPSSSLFFTKTCWPTYNILFSLPREA